MLKIEKRSPLSKQFRILWKGAEVGKLSRERGQSVGGFDLGGRPLVLDETPGKGGKNYRLKEGKRELLAVNPISPESQQLSFRLDTKTYMMVDKVWGFQVKKGGNEVGRTVCLKLLVPWVEVKLPDYLSVEVQVFLGWIALRRWEEDMGSFLDCILDPDFTWGVWEK